MKKSVWPFRLAVIFVLLCISIAAYGENTWSVAAGGSQRDVGLVIQPTLADGGAIAAGSSGLSSAFVLKLDSAGQIRWMKKANLNHPHSIVVLNDGYVISDRTRVIKLNLQGDFVWGSRFVVNGDLSNFVLLNAGFLFAVNTGKNFRIIKIDNRGKVVWARQYKSDGCAEGNFITRVQTASQNGFLLVGGSHCLPDKIRIIRLNVYGQVLWQRDYEAPSFRAVVTSFKRFSAGHSPDGYLLAANLFGAASKATLILEINTSGDIRWQKAIDGNRQVRIFVWNIFRDSREYFFLAGSTILRLDDHGNILSATMPRMITAVGETGFLHDIEQAGGEFYFATGRMKRPSPNFGTDMWILKLNEAFETPEASCVFNRVPAPLLFRQITIQDVVLDRIHSNKIKLSPKPADYVSRDFKPVVTTCQ